MSAADVTRASDPANEAGPRELVFSPGDFSFVECPGATTLWKAPARAARGVYLWCIPYEDAWLVHYVGKAGGKGGFETRLWREHKDWENGDYCKPVDIELFKRGVLRYRPGPLTPEHLAEQLRELRPIHRVLLLVLPSDHECREIESTLVHRLRQDPDTFQFLCNRDKRTAYKTSCAVTFAPGSPRVIGLNAPVPESLREAVAAASALEA